MKPIPKGLLRLIVVKLRQAANKQAFDANLAIIYGADYPAARRARDEKEKLDRVANGLEDGSIQIVEDDNAY